MMATNLKYSSNTTWNISSTIKMTVLSISSKAPSKTINKSDNSYTISKFLLTSEMISLKLQEKEKDHPIDGKNITYLGSSLDQNVLVQQYISILL